MTLHRGFAKNAATTPADTRLMDAGSLIRNADGSVRTGVLGSPLPLVTGTAGMSVNIGAANFVQSKSTADGAMRFANDGVISQALPAAPTANSRYDVVYVKQDDDTTGDTDALPVSGVVSGAAAATPTVPAVPTGAIALASIRVTTGMTATSAAVITPLFDATAAMGGSILYRTLADLQADTKVQNAQVGQEIGSGGEYMRIAGAWTPTFIPNFVRHTKAKFSTSTSVGGGSVVLTHTPATMPFAQRVVIESVSHPQMGTAGYYSIGATATGAGVFVDSDGASASTTGVPNSSWVLAGTAATYVRVFTVDIPPNVACTITLTDDQSQTAVKQSFFSITKFMAGEFA
ncbi:MAG: 18, gp18 [Frankiales bacterium]|nr:18, gp18 [Frankiales bacterium]